MQIKYETITSSRKWSAVKYSFLISWKYDNHSNQILAQFSYIVTSSINTTTHENNLPIGMSQNGISVCKVWKRPTF